VLEVFDDASGGSGSTNSGGILLQNNNAGVNGARLQLYHNSASPAANDLVGAIDFNGQDSGAGKNVYGSIVGSIENTTAGAEIGNIILFGGSAGLPVRRATVRGGINGLEVGNRAADAILTSGGNFDLILQTGNATTGTITLQDGTNGDFLLTPNGSGMVGINQATPAAKLHVTESTLGNPVQTLSSVATNDDPTEVVTQGRVATTDATVTTIQTIAIPASTTVAIESIVVARRTGGASGTAEDGARYRISAVYANIAGAATIIGSVTRTIDESVPAYNATFSTSGGNVIITVAGPATTNVTWHSTTRTYAVST
jgi:hypothetical protein